MSRSITVVVGVLIVGFFVACVVANPVIGLSGLVVGVIGSGCLAARSCAGAL